jgi:hypothetical protein
MPLVKKIHVYRYLLLRLVHTMWHVKPDAKVTCGAGRSASSTRLEQ